MPPSSRCCCARCCSWPSGCCPYALNTIAAIAGALAAGFVLIPVLGLHGSLQGLGAGAAAAALAVLLAGRAAGVSRVAALSIGLAALGASLALPRWDQALFTSGAYKYASAMTADALQVSLSAGIPGGRGGARHIPAGHVREGRAHRHGGQRHEYDAREQAQQRKGRATGAIGVGPAQQRLEGREAHRHRQRERRDRDFEPGE
mgnify:CR=1 FL=1